MAELAAADAAKKLAEATNVAATSILAAAFKMGAVQRGEYLTNVPSPTSGGGGGGGGGSVPSPMMTQAADYQSYRSGERATNVTLELAPNTDTLGQLFYDSFLINQRDGKSQLYNGGIKGG